MRPHKVFMFSLLITILSACTDDASVDCDDYIYAEPMQTLIYEIKRFGEGKLFATEETPEACYSYALDYIDSDDNKSTREGYCGNDYTVKQWERVEFTDSKLINKKDTLTAEEALTYAKKFCNYNDGYPGYGHPVEQITSFETTGNELIFQYEREDGMYQGRITTTDQDYLACPIHSIKCYTEKVDITEVPPCEIIVD